MKPAYVPLFLLLSAARGAVDIEGARVVEPLSSDDPSPIADVLTYVPDQHDCPLPCHTDYSNIHRWTLYYSVERFQRCEMPMLLHFSALRPLDDPQTDILIRACTLGPPRDDANDRTVLKATAMSIDNPKHSTELYQASLDIEPACAIDGKAISHGLSFATGGGEGLVPVQEITCLLDGIRDFFDTKDNCDETFLFAYNKNIVASLHIRAGLGKSTMSSAVRAVAGRLQTGGAIANQTVAQVCRIEKSSGITFGIFIDTTRDILKAQRVAAAWSQGSCVPETHIPPPLNEEVLEIDVFDIAATPLEVEDID